MESHLQCRIMYKELLVTYMFLQRLASSFSYTACSEKLNTSWQTYTIYNDLTKNINQILFEKKLLAVYLHNSQSESGLMRN